MVAISECNHASPNGTQPMLYMQSAEYGFRDAEDAYWEDRRDLHIDRRDSAQHEAWMAKFHGQLDLARIKMREALAAHRIAMHAQRQCVVGNDARPTVYGWSQNDRFDRDCSPEA